MGQSFPGASECKDAFNLAWKLALVHQGTAHETLLDSYEMEHRPAAELVTKSGDVSEHTLTVADPKTLHHEIVAETELNVDYAHSPIVFGDANSSFASWLHAFGQRAGSTQTATATH